jgi:hypothetical protein
MAKYTEKTKAKPHVVEQPNESIVIQLHHRRRGSDGRLEEKTSKSLTVHNLSLEEVYQRILKTLKE